MRRTLNEITSTQGARATIHTNRPRNGDTKIRRNPEKDARILTEAITEEIGIPLQKMRNMKIVINIIQEEIDMIDGTIPSAGEEMTDIKKQRDKSVAVIMMVVIVNSLVTHNQSLVFVEKESCVRTITVWIQ
jgi:hypothetical protein